eukprot:2027782-Prymnesium_polylepis.2
MAERLPCFAAASNQRAAASASRTPPCQAWGEQRAGWGAPAAVREQAGERAEVARAAEGPAGAQWPRAGLGRGRLYLAREEHRAESALPLGVSERGGAAQPLERDVRIARDGPREEQLLEERR